MRSYIKHVENYNGYTIYRFGRWFKSRYAILKFMDNSPEFEWTNACIRARKMPRCKSLAYVRCVIDKETNQ